MTAHKINRCFRAVTPGPAPQRSGDGRRLPPSSIRRSALLQTRMYQLIRQKGRARDRLFEIEILDPGAQAFSFTFG